MMSHYPLDSDATYSYQFDGDLSDEEVSQLEDAINTAVDELNVEDVSPVVNTCIDSDEPEAHEDAVSEFASEYVSNVTSLNESDSHVYHEAVHVFGEEVVKVVVSEEMPTLF